MQLLEWLSLEQVVRDEFIQAREEGKLVDSLEEEWKRVLELPDDARMQELRQLYDRIARAPIRSDYPYVEPTDLDEIRTERRVVSSQLTGHHSVSLSREQLFDKVYGAWLGRCAGCLLGKPVEGMTRNKIASLLKWKGDLPLSFYISRKGGLPPGFEMDSEEVKRYETGVFENVKQMLRDDDIDYTLIGLHVLEQYGHSFTSMDIGATWLQCMPLLMTYTAERVAYKNLANGLRPPETAIVYNPYREWIGAQIRGDMWGYVNPGNPKQAAEFAFRDATVSHQKNGVYSEMFVSATIAAAFCVDDVRSAIEYGLGEIPSRSRLAEAICNVVHWCEIDTDWETTLDRIMAHYGHYNWFHTIPNAAIVVMALLHGRGDFEMTITTAVMAGLDTDCNGATAGSILGAYLGASRLPSKWIKPLNDRISTAVVGMSDTQIRNLAERTLAIIDKHEGKGRIFS